MPRSGPTERGPGRTRRLVWWGSGAAALVVAGAVTWLVWPDEPPPPTPRAERFEDFDVCLLTGPGGISRDPAAAAWASLQPVAAEAGVRLSYLTVAGEDSVSRATSFVAVQARQGCDIIVAVGESEAGAATASMTAYPHIQFVPVNLDADASTAGSLVQPLIPRG